MSEKIRDGIRSIPNAIANNQIVRAVNGHPPIVPIDDGHTDHATAAHRSADEMEVNGIASQRVFLAEMSETAFGTNDHFPFIRYELKEQEPKTYALFLKLWNPSPRKTTKP